MTTTQNTGANLDRARAVHGLRSSGAAGTHLDRRTRGRRTRRADRGRDIRERMA